MVHEITNPVNTISMIAETFASLFDDLAPADRLDMVRQIQKERGRIQGSVSNLLDFSKPKAASMRPVGLDALVVKTLSAYRRDPWTARMRSTQLTGPLFCFLFSGKDRFLSLLRDATNARRRA